jgi:hypothetical protein
VNRVGVLLISVAVLTGATPTILNRQRSSLGMVHHLVRLPLIVLATVAVGATPALALVEVAAGRTAVSPTEFSWAGGSSPDTTAEPPPATEAPSTTRTTLVPGKAAVTQAGSPTNNTGLVVGLVAVGMIVVGALVLFLRYRGKGNTTK